MLYYQTINGQFPLLTSHKRYRGCLCKMKHDWFKITFCILLISIVKCVWYINLLNFEEFFFTKYYVIHYNNLKIIQNIYILINSYVTLVTYQQMFKQHKINKQKHVIRFILASIYTFSFSNDFNNYLIGFLN